MHIQTLAVHAGRHLDPQTGAIAPPIHLSTTYERDTENRLIGEYQYIREGNPTQTLLEEALAAVEGGESALVFASGMAAGAAILQVLGPDSRIVLPDDAYYGYRVAATDFLAGWGVRTEFVDMEDYGAFAAAARGAQLVWLETPSNPLLKVVDLAGAIAAAREAGAVTIVDNTFATPALQRPIAHGADLVLHAATKYIGGHSDVQAGALVFARRGELFEKVEHARHILGGVASPFNSWLALRGLRTLPCRMEKHSDNAVAVASALAGHPEVTAVHYPGLPSHPGHAIAKRQMAAFGGMLSFRVRGGRDAAVAAAGRAKLFTRATSLGGVESLIEHRATSEGKASKAPPELIRLSVGLEHPDDLIADLRQALGGA
ncbi:MAG: PLP-dependent aspartate aminotransferase family protein [Thermoanaerobaculia bacterium]